TREVERGLAKRLGRNGSGIHRRSAGLGRALDDAHALAEVRGLRRALFSRGPSADDDEIVILAHGRRGARRPGLMRLGHAERRSSTTYIGSRVSSMKRIASCVSI